MKFRDLLTAGVALCVAATPTLASAAPIATPLTQPAKETANGDSAFASSTGIILAVLALAAIGGGIAAAVSDDNTRPNSP